MTKTTNNLVWRALGVIWTILALASVFMLDNPHAGVAFLLLAAAYLLAHNRPRRI